jgi:hypothetical protein
MAEILGGEKFNVAIWLIYNLKSDAVAEDAEAHPAPLNSVCSGREWLL